MKESQKKKAILKYEKQHAKIKSKGGFMLKILAKPDNGSVVKNVDYKIINKQRRSRGYSHESGKGGLKERLEKAGWWARRLGGSSANLPDIVATSPGVPHIIYCIEAKSVMMPKSRYAYVPRDQVVRCATTLDVFHAYHYRFVILAFRFQFAQHSGKKPIYHFFKMDWQGPFEEEKIENCINMRCDINGNLMYHYPDGSYRSCPEFDKVDDLPFVPRVRYIAK